MIKIELELATKHVNNRPLVFEFRRCLFTAFFVLIPVQRLRIIFDLRWRDITLYDGNKGGCIQVGIEKTSFGKLGRGETIGRSLFIPEVLSRFIRCWKLITKFNAPDYYLFVADGRYLVSSEASRLVTLTTKLLTRKHVTAQTLRKLRITHILDSVLDGAEVDVVVDRLAEEAGNSALMVKNHYWLQDSFHRMVESRKNVEEENKMLFIAEFNKIFGISKMCL